MARRKRERKLTIRLRADGTAVLNGCGVHHQVLEAYEFNWKTPPDIDHEAAFGLGCQMLKPGRFVSFTLRGVRRA